MKTNTLKIPAKVIRGTRFNRESILTELDLSMEVPKFVVASIKGHVKWKRGPGTVLKLQFFKKGSDRHEAELQLATTDKADSGFAVTPIDFEFNERHEYCKPRQSGWSRISSLVLFPPPHSFHTQPRGCGCVVSARAIWILCRHQRVGNQIDHATLHRRSFREVRWHSKRSMSPLLCLIPQRKMHKTKTSMTVTETACFRGGGSRLHIPQQAPQPCE